MKRIILVTTLLLTITSLGAVEITVLGGANSAIWYRQTRGPDYGYARSSSSGISTQAGVLVGFDIINLKKPSAFKLGFETGFVYKYAQYSQRHVSTSDAIIITPPTWNFRFEEIPVLVKMNLQKKDIFRIGAGIGPVLVKTIRGSWGRGLYEHHKADAQLLGTTLGVQARLDTGIKLSQHLWLKPLFAVQYSPRPDIALQPEPDYTISSFVVDIPEPVQLTGKELTFYFSLGLALRL